MDITESLQMLLVSKWVSYAGFRLIVFPGLTDNKKWW